MKWYFACNNKSESFFSLIKAAVNSAVENTTLQPHFIYDGQPDELTVWMEEKGVKVIYHRVSFYDSLKSHYSPECLHVPAGAFLRCDIPLIEKEDEIILYTDCDVIFLKEINEENAPKPEYFSCSSQFKKWDFVDFNTGVMFMNVKNLAKSHSEFTSFISKNLRDFPVFDQSAYQLFYKQKNEFLNIKYNHKPYWGIDNDAKIVHYHGIKPIDFCTGERLQELPIKIAELFRKNVKSYDYYLTLFQVYNPDVAYDCEVIANLKNGVYPLIKNTTRPLMLRLKTFLRKKKDIIVHIVNVLLTFLKKH